MPLRERVPAGEDDRHSPPPRNIARRGAIDRQGGWLEMSQRSDALIYYVGVLDGAGSVWGVRVPDIPGCVGGGATAEAANTDVAEALRDVAAHKRDGGFDIPRASTLTEIVASGEIGEGESAVMIPLLIDSGRTVRANVSFDAALLDAIDAAAKERGLTRSAFLSSAARGKIMAGAPQRPGRE